MVLYYAIFSLENKAYLDLFIEAVSWALERFGPFRCRGLNLSQGQNEAVPWRMRYSIVKYSKVGYNIL